MWEISCKHFLDTTATLLHLPRYHYISKVTKHSNSEPYFINSTVKATSWFLLIEFGLCKVEYAERAEIPFNNNLDNYRKDGNNPKAIPPDFHFRKSG